MNLDVPGGSDGPDGSQRPEGSQRSLGRLEKISMASGNFGFYNVEGFSDEEPVVLSGNALESESSQSVVHIQNA